MEDILAKKICIANMAPLFLLAGISVASAQPTEPAKVKYETPVDILVREYEKKQILVMAHPGHDDSRAYFVLSELLQRVGTDPNLKQIILERPLDNSNLYQELSVRPNQNVLPEFPFLSEKSKTFSLCEPEWAYSISKFMPLIKDLNRLRKNPVLVKSIDSVSSALPVVDPVEMAKSISPTDCDLTGDHLLIFPASGNRELKTAEIFRQRVWRRLKRNEKIIILYNYAHVTKGLISCMPFRDDDGGWYSKLTPSNWMSLFLKQSPEAESNISTVLIDGEEQPGSLSGVLKAGKRLIPPQNFEDWGINAVYLKNEPEIGGEIFLDNSFLKTYHLGKVYGTASLSGVYDGYVWIKSPFKRFALKKATEYLPEFCK